MELANGRVLSLYSGSRGEKVSLFLRTEQVIETHVGYPHVLYCMLVTQEFVLGIAVGIAVSQHEKHLPHCLDAVVLSILRRHRSEN